MSAMPARHVVTAEKFERMVDAGVFTDERVELMLGEIVDMSPIGSAHQACVNRLTWLFAPLATSGDALLQVQGSIRLDNQSEPQPDVALLRPRGDFYAKGHPRARDVLLVVEVADTSLQYDRLTKLPAYAAAGIREAWVVDLNAGVIDVATRPSRRGYGRQLQLKRGDTIRPGALPDLVVTVDQVVGEAPPA
jgi:Uma2 family endonuclease